MVFKWFLNGFLNGRLFGSLIVASLTSSNLRKSPPRKWSQKTETATAAEHALPVQLRETTRPIESEPWRFFLSLFLFSACFLFCFFTRTRLMGNPKRLRFLDRKMKNRTTWDWALRVFRMETTQINQENMKTNAWSSSRKEAGSNENALLRSTEIDPFEKNCLMTANSQSKLKHERLLTMCLQTGQLSFWIRWRILRGGKRTSGRKDWKH